MIAWSVVAGAAEPDEVVVEGETPVDTATGRHLDAEAVDAFPARSADELLRAVPGLVLSAHGGRGKAFQFLVRGFDAQHGADLAVSVEGVPINEPSNVHGQGYLDLHFLPTALVSGLDVAKGSYAASDGDFAITGTADYAVGLGREGLRLESQLGSDRSGRELAAFRPRGADAGTFLVGEAEGGVGVGEGRRYHQLRAAAGLERGGLRGAVFLYDGRFESPGALRTDDLEDGSMGFWEAWPVGAGGRSTRALAFAAGEVARGDLFLDGVAWTGARALALDQNFTGWLSDPVHGDGTRQSELAGQAGAKGTVGGLFPALGRTWALRGGLDLRGDRLQVNEADTTVDGRVWRERVDADTAQLDAGAWSELRAELGSRLSLVPGVRLEHLELGARDTLDEAFLPIDEPTWTRSTATLALPRGTLALEVAEPLTLYASGGRGFRSPQARGTADGDRAPVTLSDSGEAGLRLGAGPVALQSTAFAIVVGDELVFDPVTARFLSAGRTRRVGVEGVVDAWPTPDLHLQGDATFVDARFTQDDTAIPYAPRVLLAAAAYAEGLSVARGARLVGGLRTTWLGPRPLPSGFASRPSLVGTLSSRVDADGFSVGLDVDNLYGRPWRDGEFVYPSWFDRDEPRSELKVVHVTAGDPFAVRLTLGLDL